MHVFVQEWAKERERRAEWARSHDDLEAAEKVSESGSTLRVKMDISYD